MRTLPAGVLLLLASCMTAPTDAGSQSPTLSRTSAPSVSEQAALLRTQAQRQTSPAPGAAETAPAPGGSTVAPNVPIDRNRKLETVDVFTDLMDPASSKQLVSFLMRPEEWMVVRVDMPSPTTRWWRFQRVARTDGTALPDVDPLRRR